MAQLWVLANPACQSHYSFVKGIHTEVPQQPRRSPIHVTRKVHGQAMGIRHSWLPQWPLRRHDFQHGHVHIGCYPSEVISNSGQRVQGSSRLHLQRYHCSRTNLGSEGYLSTMAVKEAWILACVEGRPFYRPPGNPVLVGSGSYSPTQQGIPTHRYGGPAALKVEIRQACFRTIH